MKKRRKRKGVKGGCLLAVVCICLAAAVSFAALKGTRVKSGIIDSLAGNDRVPYQKVAIEEGNFDNKYYYSLIDDGEKECYKEITQGLKDEAKEIYVHCDDVNRANELFQYVLKDFPGFFWCEGGAESTGYTGGLGTGEGYTVIRPVYTCTGDEKESRQAEIDKAVTKCLAGVPADAGDYEKILYVYEYIVNTVDYDLEAEDNQNIYSVFSNRRSVCAGYSKAAQYLLERLGVFCTYVTGTAANQEAHAWNLVMCDGEYYYVDTTWGDPVYQQAEGEEVQEWQNISYDYMCCSDEELFKTHALNGDVPFPACVSMAANYYVRNGMYYENFDSQDVLKDMNDVIASQSNPSVFKFASRDIYDEAKAEVLDDLVHRAAQNLAGMYGLSQVQYYYQDEPELNKIVIYWQYE